ncbi:hypothetical protein HanPSC8_Chr07g0285371 [Helianthus annuus]|nr:hypothetical protein HanPSC8_Chr07g0283301 [Helianthus annuus]KAJ0904706.1 hypothetical protein HanPSC8_Chr07g0285371 [Helianthus annuus]
MIFRSLSSTCHISFEHLSSTCHISFEHLSKLDMADPSYTSDLILRSLFDPSKNLLILRRTDDLSSTPVHLSNLLDRRMIFRGRKLSFDGPDTRTESTTGVRKVDVVGDQLSQISKHENLKFEFCFILRKTVQSFEDKQHLSKF